MDMDGLLVDTEGLWTIAEQELAASFGRSLTPEIKHAMVGHGIDTAVPLMLSLLGVPDADPVAAAHFLLDRAFELFRTPGMVIPRPGARELLAALRSAGVPTALVSSSFRALMDPVLDELGREHFTVTVAGDEVTRRKPFPDPYLIAAAMLDLPPRRCVVLEDSTAGALAGLRAGCHTVLVPSSPDLPSLAEVAQATAAALATDAAAAAASVGRIPPPADEDPAVPGVLADPAAGPVGEDIAAMAARLRQVASLAELTVDDLAALLGVAQP
ncbi:MAG: HAD family phosphatase [Frankia sp.]|nr:HAD family phosphatase [Frankia sp.]